jgi:hypothetical protein
MRWAGTQVRNARFRSKASGWPGRSPTYPWFFPLLDRGVAVRLGYPDESPGFPTMEEKMEIGTTYHALGLTTKGHWLP